MGPSLRSPGSAEQRAARPAVRATRAPTPEPIQKLDGASALAIAGARREPPRAQEPSPSVHSVFSAHSARATRALDPSRRGITGSTEETEGRRVGFKMGTMLRSKGPAQQRGVLPFSLIPSALCDFPVQSDFSSRSALKTTASEAPMSAAMAAHSDEKPPKVSTTNTTLIANAATMFCPTIARTRRE